jgi:hypothetical protein
VATSFLVLPYGTRRSLLCTETRTVTTDPASARQFRRARRWGMTLGAASRTYLRAHA